ncbi:MAG TPA: flagellar biosynthesis protein FliQ [Aquabacterium sp.]|uniref:flagellar biosynthesis protein FliQ n=1 Tax=Aquabacterium sp. TaxID=1872578 RepID=UPI002E30B367|nr:flagellar biosynthesis protein FliQ [Aquabacterium sp.]HEX5356458.1 flagellar biosynthesis protein FliQ [Aquabacterium sp.]
MDPQQVLTFSRDGLLTLLTVCGPIVLVVLAVGLIVSIFQAATQIHEQTLSFVPKLLAAFATLAVAGPWMMSKLVDYIQQVLQSIPSVVG